MKHERWMRLQRESEALQAWARKPLKTEPQPIPIMYRAHDPILHTDEQPFCSDPFCPCHDVITDEHANEAYWRLICEPMKNGLMTAEEANRIFFNEQV